MRFAIVLSVLCLAGCAVEASGPVDDGTSAQNEEAARRLSPCATVRCAAGTHCVAKGKTASCVADKAECTTDADCRLFDNYCGGCACNALASSEPDPKCDGTLVKCFAEPCGGKAAACVNGTCQVADAAPAGEACGSSVCPSGQVCCNASCGICTAPGDSCIQLFCN